MMDEMKTSAYCGLFCDACAVFIASKKHDVDALNLIARKMGTTAEEMVCYGCRSDRLSSYCRACEFKRCASEKQIDFCSQCQEYPCAKLKEFQVKMPHRAELFESLDYLKTHGLTEWRKKMEEDYACHACQTMNSAYSIACKNCGRMPANGFVERHLEKIKKHLQIQ